MDYVWDNDGHSWNSIGFGGTISSEGDSFIVHDQDETTIADHLVSETGHSLTKLGTGTLWLTGSNTALAGGIRLQGGTLGLGSDTAFGTWAQGGSGQNDANNNQAFMNSAGMVTVANHDSAIKVTSDRTITNHFMIGVPSVTGLQRDSSGSLTLDIAQGHTLTITGVTNTAMGDLGHGGAISVNVQGDLTTPSIPISTLKFGGSANSPQGHLVLSSNTAQNGGAISSSLRDASHVSSLDFTGLESITFADNQTTGGNGGAIYSNANGASSVILGDHATFSQNNASAGGAIYSNSSDSFSSIILGDYASFSENTGSAIYSFAIGPLSSVTLGAHATFSGNKNTANGGAIYSNAPLDSSIITLGAHATFSNNAASNSGGAIYTNAHSSSSAAPQIKLGDYSQFLSNMAGNNGGAIYAYASSVQIEKHATFHANITQGAGGGIFVSSSSLTLGKYATFTSNEAAAGAGLFTSNKSTLTLGTHALFSKNTAWFGAAIYADHDLNISGNTFFKDNQSTQKGGAIYLVSNSTPITATLSALGGAIAFSRNTNGGTANSIHLHANIRLELIDDGDFYFDDPLSSNTTTEDRIPPGNNSLIKAGSGFVQFVGHNQLNTSSYAASDYSVDITGGTFRIVNNGTSESFDATGSGKFRVGAGATLAGSGKIQSSGGFTISGTLSADSDRFEIPEFVDKGHAEATEAHYNYFKSGRTTVDDAYRIGTLNLEGNVSFDPSASVLVDINGTDNDLLIVNGRLNYGNATLSINLMTSNELATSYQLFEATSTSGNFSSISILQNTTSIGALAYNNATKTWSGVFIGMGMIFDQSTGMLSFSVVPEPAVCALTIGLLSLAIVLRRRRGFCHTSR